MQARVARVLSVLPVVLLLVVAGWQAVRVQTHDQSPWIGAGFSMFVTVDGAAYRPLVVVDADQPGVSIPIPDGLRREADRLKAAPTDGRAARFAASISAETGRRVRVEVWRPIFDAASVSVSAELIAAGVSG